MPSTLIAAGLDPVSLFLEAPFLKRERHVVEERGFARDLLQDIARINARVVVLGPRLPDLGVPETIRRIRSSPVTRAVSILVLLPADAPAELETDSREAGANAVLRRPLDTVRLEAWLGKLLAVPRRVEARVTVEGQVVGSTKGGGAHFCGLTRNLSTNGMLLASPVRLPDSPDLELEFTLPGLPARLRALGRVVRDAPEVGWPYLGYGVEFLFVPPESQEAIGLVLSQALPSTLIVDLADVSHGIHSTVRREEWVYEILVPVAREVGWLAEIRRGPRESWRPGLSGPFYVVEGSSPENALRQARDFVARQG
jgi:CheY-like chemotaxis protein